VLYEFRQEVLLDGKTVNTRRVLTAEAYTLLKQSRAGSSVEVRKEAMCFTWQGNYYEVCSYTDATGGALPDACALRGCQVLDLPRGAPIPPWLPACDSSKDAAAVPDPSADSDCNDKLAARSSAGRRQGAQITRQLSRNATVEAASSVEKTLAKPPPSSKRARDEPPEEERPLKRQSSVPENSSLSKVVAGSLSPVAAVCEQQPESCPQ